MTDPNPRHPARRAFIQGLLAFSAIGPIAGAAKAQSVVDKEMTDFLRNGLTPPRAKQPGPQKEPAKPAADNKRPAAGAKPAKEAKASKKRSTLPANKSIPVQAGKKKVSVWVDPDVAVDMDIQFAFDSARLLPKARRDLSILGELLRTDLKSYRYLLAGHTDISGSLDYNMRLSLRRAMAVRDFLIQEYGIAPERLFANGFGPHELRDPQRPRSRVNRRVEVVLVVRSQ